MNFDWLKDFLENNWSSWDDESFKRFGIRDDELVYVWAMTGVSDITLKYIEELVVSGIQEYWQENDDIFQIEGNEIIVSNVWRKSSYGLPHELFVKHVALVTEAKQNAS